MRRRLAMLLSATLVAGLAVILVPASPASAGVHVCGISGQASLTTGLTYPVTAAVGLPWGPLPPHPHPIHITVHQPRTTTFVFNVSIVGGCINSNPPNVKSPTFGTPITAFGTVSGWCGLSSGSGTITLTASNMRFAWIDVGGILVVTGGVAGVVNAMPDTLAGHSCNNSNAGASQLILSGSLVAFDHCPVKFKGLTPVPIPGFLTTTLFSLPFGTPVALLSIHNGPWHVWTKVCVPVPFL